MEINLSDDPFMICRQGFIPEDIVINKKFDILSPGAEKYSFQFSRVPGERFFVSFDIPDDAENAYVTLNGKKLLGFFSADIPDISLLPDAAVREITAGSEDHFHDTTLAPGRNQKISFRWQTGDELIFYIYKNTDSDCKAADSGCQR